ncbi:uncharacterized protein [Littorina saxatilis]|uniref:uncharacterized protein n=1 Tax=Littorina saxatilis TaxID=31220 RepID=UPI0038B5F75B
MSMLTRSRAMAEKRAASQTEEVQAGHGQEDWQPRPPFHTTPRGMLGSASSPGRGRGRGKLFDDRTVRQSGGYPAPGQAEGGFVTLSKGDVELKHHIPQFPSPQVDTSAVLLQFLQVDREERRRREQKEEEERSRREQKEEEERSRREQKEEEERSRREQKEEEERSRREQKEEEERSRREQKEEEERKRREEKEAEEKEKERKFWQLMLEHETDRERARVEREEKREKARVEKEEKTIKGVKIPTLEDKDNIEEYLDQFERIAGTQGWKKETWIARLLPQLRGTARSLYFTLPTEEAGNYDQFRDALMKRFNLTAEGYRKKFRESRKEQSETFAQFVVRIKSYFKKWVCLCKKNFEKGEDLQDVILTEQLMETLSSDLMVKVKERKPANVVEAAEAADVVIEAKKGVRKPQRGHLKKDCKKVGMVVSFPGKVVSGGVPSLCESCHKKDFEPRCTVQVNGVEVPALRDTGAESLIIDASLVPCGALTGRKQNVTFASTNYQTVCDTAVVDVVSPFFAGKALALVMENPLFPVIIGNHVEMETGQVFRVPVYSKDPEEGAVETRAQVRKKRVPGKPLPVSKPLIGQTGPEGVAQMQSQDDTLEKVREYAQNGKQFGSGDGTIHFVKKKSLYYRAFSGPAGSYSQLVVPKQLRQEVLRLAHDSPIAGHLGAKKTRERVWQTFYWPGLCADVRRYCASCDVCQRTVPRGVVRKAPLEQMPLMDEPFKRVAVDLVGPILPASWRGFRRMS